MKPFKFFRTPFNPRQYDVDGFTFIGVSPIKTHEDVQGRYRTMIFMNNDTRLPLTGNLIQEHEEPYHQADIIEIRGEQIFQLPRQEAEYINVTLTFTPNNGYSVKVKWTPTKDNVDRYIFANIKVDTLSNYRAARINTGYNYRASNPTIPIILDRVNARNYPDSVEFNDVNLTSKKPYYVSLQMVNKEGNASAYTQVIYSPKDPLQSIDNAIPGLYNAKFSWGDYNNDGLMDLAVIGQNDDVGNITKIYENKNGSFQDLNLANRAFRYGDVKWVDLNNDGWLDLSIIGQSGAAVVYQQLINNKGVFEVSTPSSVAGLKYATMTFGDYNNNGTLDMFTTGQDVNGNPHSYLYQNDGKGNFKIDPEFNSIHTLYGSGYQWK